MANRSEPSILRKLSNSTRPSVQLEQLWSSDMPPARIVAWITAAGFVVAGVVMAIVEDEWSPLLVSLIIGFFFVWLS